MLQKVSRNILNDASYLNRWVPLTSNKNGLELRHKFNSPYPITNMSLSKAISKIELMIENLDHKHQSGLYRTRLLRTEMIFVNKNLY